MAGIGIGASRFLKKTAIGGVAYGPYTTAFQSTVVSRGGSLTTNELTYLNTFETSMGSNLDEFDRLWIHGLSNNVAARTSFVNPASTIVSAVNSPTFLPNVGYQGNGVNSYLNLNYNAFTDSVKFTGTSESFGSYYSSNPTLAFAEGGYYGMYGTYLYNDSLSFRVNLCSNNDYTTGVQFDNGLNYAIRDGISMNSVIDSTLNSPVNAPFLGKPNGNLFGLAFSSSGSPALFLQSSVICSLKFIGSSNFNKTTFYNSIQTLGTSLGWAVTSLNNDLYASYNLESNANDLSGNGINGTLVNSPTFSSGKFLQGVNFNGANYISTAASTFNPSGDFSFSIWVNPSSHINFMGILDKFIFGGGNSGWGLDIPTASSKLARFLINTSTATYIVSSTSPINISTWTNIICVFSSNTIKIYVNGVLENTTATSGTLVSNAQQLFIGGDNGSTLLFSGSMDAFNFWTRSLTPTEISTLQNYQNPFY